MFSVGLLLLKKKESIFKVIGTVPLINQRECVVCLQCESFKNRQNPFLGSSVFAGVRG